MLILAALAAISLPPSGKPAMHVIDQIEAGLSRNRCVGSLSRWWRHYAYWYEGKTDARYVDVWFVEAGHENLPAGRFITEPEAPMLDDSQFRLVSGKYEIATRRFVRFACGFNHPGKPADWNGR